MNTLERAYSAMLHEAFNYTVTSGIAQRARELAANIRCKLHANVPDHEQEGWTLLKEMLEHGREEFQWQNIMEILESATQEARIHKADSYQVSQCMQCSRRPAATSV